jgi:thymidine kinase
MAKLYFYYSAMNAGKSTVLLQSSYNYKERGMDTLLYSPIIDDRFGGGKISSRIGLSAEAKSIDTEFNLFSDAKNEIVLNPKIACILVDEAQFLKKAQITQLCQIVDELNIPVLCYGLRSDFQAEPFEGSLYLLALADNLIEVKTVCHCGRKASMNMRVDTNGKKVEIGAQIQVGGNDLYVATCRKHFNAGISGVVSEAV